MGGGGWMSDNWFVNIGRTWVDVIMSFIKGN